MGCLWGSRKVLLENPPGDLLGGSSGGSVGGSLGMGDLFGNSRAGDPLGG